MITVEWGHDGQHFTDLVVSGHAEYDVHGKDIVCSAVTALLFGVKNTVEYLSLVKGGSKEGYFNIIIASPNAMTDIIVNGFLDTVKQIDAKYPGKIDIQEDEE